MMSRYWERDSAVTYCWLIWTTYTQPGPNIFDSPGLFRQPMNDNKWNVSTIVMEQQTTFWRERNFKELHLQVLTGFSAVSCCLHISAMCCALLPYASSKFYWIKPSSVSLMNKTKEKTIIGCKKWPTFCAINITHTDQYFRNLPFFINNK